MKPKRQGMILITTLVIMAVLAVVLAVVTTQVVAQRTLLRTRERQLQADWLARAGIESAAARLLHSPKEFAEDDRNWIPDGKVKIEVKRAADGVFVISTEAEVGAAAEKPVIRTATARFRRTEGGGMIRLVPER